MRLRFLRNGNRTQGRSESERRRSVPRSYPFSHDRRALSVPEEGGYAPRQPTPQSRHPAAGGRQTHTPEVTFPREGGRGAASTGMGRAHDHAPARGSSRDWTGREGRAGLTVTPVTAAPDTQPPELPRGAARRGAARALGLRARSWRNEVGRREGCLDLGRVWAAPREVALARA